MLDLASEYDPRSDFVNMHGATSLRAPAIVGIVATLLSLGGITIWSTTAMLASAVIVPAVVVVDSGRKSVQHQDGGVIQSIDVVDGQDVAAKQRLLTLDGTQLSAAADTIRRLLAMNAAERLRLEAERSGSEQPKFPTDNAEVGSVAFGAIALDEARLFEARKASLAAKISTLRSDEDGARASAISLDQQISFQRARVALTQQELEDARRLLQTHDVSRQHVLEVTRSLAELSGETEDLISRANEARQQSEHSRLEALRTTAAFIESVNTDLRQAEKTRLDLVEKLRTVSDQIGRLRVVAPVAGRIINLAVHTVGGVAMAGATLLEIVPDNDPLEVEGEVRPEDVDSIRPGLSAKISLTGFVGQQLPRLSGTVLRVSSDRIEDPVKGSAYFRVRVGIPAQARKRLGSHDLRPGMAVTMMLCNGQQTPLDYLVSPLLAFFSKAMHS